MTRKNADKVAPPSLEGANNGQTRRFMIAGGATAGLVAAGLAHRALASGIDVRELTRGHMAKLKAAVTNSPQGNLAFTGPAGQALHLSDFAGKIVVLNLWATWCNPCVEEMPTLARLARHYRNQSVAVIALSVDNANKREEARTTLARLSSGQLAFYQDAGMRSAFSLRSRGFPTTIIFDRAGKELARLEGNTDWASRDAIRLIDAALAGG